MKLPEGAVPTKLLFEPLIPLTGTPDVDGGNISAAFAANPDITNYIQSWLNANTPYWPAPWFSFFTGAMVNHPVLRAALNKTVRLHVWFTLYFFLK
jgi:hypothetical protein